MDAEEKEKERKYSQIVELSQASLIDHFTPNAPAG